ncbi:ribosomal protein S3 [Candidatus Carsonella ruddii CS isolate Thao2000]|uniref:Small ribosomal subunit protein uS3 n=1 Tax=Candidatus Carsonella ruddii CS isolate Thao2000 TaxID=1202537 RepID=J7GYY5_CARRU|nr:30S ribosomal protein S3 [Candidatus Carsonella ruddii]AFP83823.1 ribosomal protein S3 [Candidatus Carsonella ruddii CS isolate Thao2000]
MGKKINPIFFRLGKNINYHSLWYCEKKKFSFFLKKDILLREIIKKVFFFIDLNNIDIIFSNKLIINLYLNNFENILNIENYLDLLILEIYKIFKKNILLNLINNIFVINSKKIALYLINYINNKNSIKKIIKRECLKYSDSLNGCKIQISGRLEGVEIARKEWFLFGRIPLHTIRLYIDYHHCEIITQYGVLGIKIWIFKK